jgi:hypothetical protein
MPGVAFEDLLVALADTCWRGKRDEALETLVGQWIARHMLEEPWEAFLKLDAMATAITDQAEARIAWQNNH